MDQLRKLLASLSIAQRISLITAAIAIIGGAYWLLHWRTESDFRPIFTNLSAEDAGAIVTKLKEAGVEYRLDPAGNTVLAPSAKIAELRLDMASAGLPKTGRIGFELFDKNNFGATEFTERVNFRRALEGELERSIMALSAVESARVHITFPRDSVFLESQQPAKASIVVTLRKGARLSQANIVAISNLAASAVEGLSPDAVSIIDAQGNLVGRPKAQNAAETSPPAEDNLDYKKKVEADLLTKVNTTLEPVLGAGKFRAGVTAECDFTRAEQSEETLDPNKSVMLSSQKTEESTGTVTTSGVPGTASTLPRPTARPNAGSGGGLNRHTENITYQTSRVVRHTVLPQGAIKRISVSVLLDQQVRWQGAGAKAKRIIDPPSPEKLKTVKDILSGVIGFDEERGDILMVESLPFEMTLNSEPPPGPAAPAAPASALPLPAWLAPYASNPKTLMIGAGAGALLLLFLVAAIFMLFRKKKKKAVASAEMQAAVEGGTPHPPATPIDAAASAGNVQRQLEDKLAESALLQQQAEEAALNSLKIPVVSTKKSEVLTKHLKDAVTKDTQGSANILRSWLTEGGTE